MQAPCETCAKSHLTQTPADSPNASWLGERLQHVLHLPMWVAKRWIIVLASPIAQHYNILNIDMTIGFGAVKISRAKSS